MNESSMLRPALIAGVVVGIVSAVPGLNLVNCFCCGWVIAAGALAAYLYMKQSPTACTLGQGVGLGALTGVIGAVVDTIFSIPIHFLIVGVGMSSAGQLREALERIPNLPPEVRDALLPIFSGGPASTLLFVLGGLVKVVPYAIAGMLGGAVGVALFEKRQPGVQPIPPVPPAPAGEPPPPPPPPPPSYPEGSA